MTPTAIFPWHDELWKKVITLHHAARLPHALLLVGARGIGKTNFARCLAQSLLCYQPLDNGMGCMHCSACCRFLAGSHPDFLSIHPASQSDNASEIESNHDGESITLRPGPKKASRYILIEQIRNLSEWMGLKAHYHGYKIVIIAPAEQIHHNAANSLLKNLEEPPDATLLLLATSNPAQIPITIRSRCQKLIFPSVKMEQAITWFKANNIADRTDTIQLLLALAEGGPLIAQELAQSGILQLRLNLFHEFEGVLHKKLAPVVIAQAWLNYDLEQILHLQLLWVVDMIRLTILPHTNIMNIDLADRLSRLSQLLGSKKLYEQLDLLINTVRLIRSPINPNHQLLLEDLLISWCN